MAGDFHHIFPGVRPGGYEQRSQYFINDHAPVPDGPEMNGMGRFLGQILSRKYLIDNGYGVLARQADDANSPYPRRGGQGNDGIG